MLKLKSKILENDKSYIDVKFQFQCIQTENINSTWPEIYAKNAQRY